MNSILAVKEGLPPGLWLPTAEETTQQYLSDNFNHREHPYEAIVDYGAFIVALAMLGREETGRVSVMPRTADIDDLFKAGYGISKNKLQNHYGRMKKLQRALGFFPVGYEPDRQELLERFQWLADYAYPHERLENPSQNGAMYDIIEWGSVRHLTPASNYVYKTLEGDTTEVRRMFGIEVRRGALEHSSDMDLYRFGARVIDEHGRPPKRDDLNELYHDEFLHRPSSMIRARFGTYRTFWNEFGYVLDTHGHEREDFLTIGVRWAIENGRSKITAGEVAQLSSEMKFISRVPIHKYFGGNQAFVAEVDEHYQEYLRKREGFEERGVSERVFQIACRHYELGEEFASHLESNIDPLIRLSDDSETAKYALSIIENGFNLLDEEIFNFQVEDFQVCLDKLGIKSSRARNYVFEMVPRFNAEEVLTTPST